MGTVVSAVTVGADGQLYHTIGTPAGWRPDFHDLCVQSSPPAWPPTLFKDVACDTELGSVLHVVGLAGNGVLWHTVRQNDFWQANFDLVGGQTPGVPGAFAAVGCCGGENAIYIAALGTDGTLWHQDVWSGSPPSFLPLNGPNGVSAGAPNGFLDIDCASDDGRSVHFVAVGNDGRLWHTFRDPYGIWQAAFLAVGPPQFTAVGCAGSQQTGGVEIVAVSSSGDLFHTTRNHDGTWDSVTQLTGLSLPGTAPLEFVDVGCGYDGSVLHVIAVAFDGTLRHIARDQYGWHWGEIAEPIYPQPPGSAMPLSRVACAWPDWLSASIQTSPHTDYLWLLDPDHDLEGSPDEDDDEEDEDHDDEDDEEDEDGGRPVGPEHIRQNPRRETPIEKVPLEKREPPGPTSAE
jgi:hypothetical protein